MSGGGDTFVHMFEFRSHTPLADIAGTTAAPEAPEVPEVPEVSGLHPRPDIERIEVLAVCSPTPTSMSELALIDPSALSGEDAITWLQAHERISAWWASLQAPALVRAAGSDRYISQVVFGTDVLGEGPAGPVTITDAIREELAAALRLSPATAQTRIDSARLLCGPLSATRAAQSAGEITASHVAIIVSAASRLRGIWDVDEASREAFAKQCDLLQRRVLPVAIRSTLARTRRAAKLAIITGDPVEADRRRRQSLAGCDVYVIDELDGVSTLIARMATEHAHACLSVINDLAVRCIRSAPSEAPPQPGAAGTGHGTGAGDRAGDGTGAGDRAGLGTGTDGLDYEAGHSILRIGERRSLALASLLIDGHPRGSSTDAESQDYVRATFPRPRALINLTIDLSTLLGLRDGAAELIGAGALPAEVARELLADARLKRIITDPTTGELLDYGRRTYAVPEVLRRYIAARDQTCRFPSCGTTAIRCEIDHAIPWSRGGPTDRSNLGALCTRHHQLKTHGGWRITDSDLDGGCTWTSPQGRRYEHRPSPVLEPALEPVFEQTHDSLANVHRSESPEFESQHSKVDPPLSNARNAPPPF